MGPLNSANILIGNIINNKVIITAIGHLQLSWAWLDTVIGHLLQNKSLMAAK